MKTIAIALIILIASLQVTLGSDFVSTHASFYSKLRFAPTNTADLAPSGFVVEKPYSDLRITLSSDKILITLSKRAVIFKDSMMDDFLKGVPVPTPQGFYFQIFKDYRSKQISQIVVYDEGMKLNSIFSMSLQTAEQDAAANP